MLYLIVFLAATLWAILWYFIGNADSYKMGYHRGYRDGKYKLDEDDSR